MRAALLQNTGDEKLVIVDDIECDPPEAGEVTVKIEATGVCHSDLHAMEGALPQPAPFIPGHEGAGVISAVGEGVTDLAVGDHVVVAWSPPCGSCNNCVERKQPHLCVMIQFTIAGVPRFTRNGERVYGMAGTGTFAEYLTLPQEAAVKIDDDIPFEIASLIGCGVSTGVGAAINTARVKPGSTVAVFGCGGVGIATIQGARIAGASRIFAIDLSDEKLELAKRFGATDVLRADTMGKALIEQTNGIGVDYAFEAIGNPAVVEAAVAATRRGGTTVAVGVGALGDSIKLNALGFPLSGKTLSGCMFGSANPQHDFPKLLDLYRGGKLDLEGMVTRTYTLDEAPKAFADLEKGVNTRGVIVMA
jgi:S-(hydroxymethyl)glutathione dehydrogenase / alcohol dehydrogenase